jgi:hypothetical protein
MFVMGGIDYLWYLTKRYQLVDAVSTGCKTGALSANTPYVDPAAIAGEVIVENISNIGECDLGSCSVIIDEEPGPVEDVWLLKCRVEMAYKPLTGMVKMPTSMAAMTSHPVKIDSLAEE